MSFMNELEFPLQFLEYIFSVFNFSNEIFKKDFPLGACPCDLGIISIDDIFGFYGILVRQVIFAVETAAFTFEVVLVLLLLHFQLLFALFNRLLYWSVYHITRNISLVILSVIHLNLLTFYVHILFRLLLFTFLIIIIY